MRGWGIAVALLALAAAPDTTRRDSARADSVASDASGTDLDADSLGAERSVDWATADPRVRASAEEKLGTWLTRRRAECRARALTEARAAADSLLMDYARERNLMADRPGRPQRPTAPPLLRPSDTLRLGPFLDSL